MYRPASNNKGFSEQDFGSMRAYLQRAEVRLSTMHRIGGAFLSGAGLLVLLPVFAKDAFIELGTFIGNAYDYLVLAKCLYAPEPCPNTSILIYSFPISCALVIPLAAIWLLLRDLSLFYFSANIPTDSGRDRAMFHPRFALTAIPISNDDAGEFKKEIRELQFNTDLKYFLISPNDPKNNWLWDQVGRRESEEVALSAESRWLPKTVTEKKNFDIMRMAFGFAGAYDRRLIDEVAKSELSLIRHNLLLRRIVIRYMKALISLIWTTLIFFVLIAILHPSNPYRDSALLSPGNAQFTDTRFRLLIVSLVLLVWSLTTPWLIRAPVLWVQEEYDQNKTDSTRDSHLIEFEFWVTAVCMTALLFGITGLIGLLSYWSPLIYLILLTHLALLWKTYRLKYRR